MIIVMIRYAFKIQAFLNHLHSLAIYSQDKVQNQQIYWQNDCQLDISNIMS